MRHLLLACLMGAPGALSAAQGEEPETAPMAIQTFVPPQLKEPASPTYPMSQRRLGSEGWVSLNYMVDAKGVPYDITVFESSGEAAFERAAIRAVERFRYDPAEFEGAAIDASAQISITFELSGTEQGARPFFVKRYNAYYEAREKQQNAKMIAALERMRDSKRTLYEEAFYQLVLADYEALADNPEAEYQAIGRAAFIDRDRGFLPDDALTSVLMRKLKLELEANHLAEAGRTAGALQRRKIEPGMADYLAQIITAVNNAADAPGVVRSRGRIRADNQYVHRLLKTGFSFEDVNGDLAEARLHCDKGYVGFPLRDAMHYAIKQGWSDCTLIVVGNPDTTFTLIEG